LPPRLARPSVRLVKALLVVFALATALVAAAPAGSQTGVLRASPQAVHMGVRSVGTENLKGTRITNTSGAPILLLVEGTSLPDDFGFGLMPGSTCPVFSPGGLLGPGESCDAVMNFRPSDFFAGQDQRAELTATAYDPATGAVLGTLVIEFFARGRL
jgi:hypothetical protein